MRLLRLLPQSITSQITCLVIVAVLLGVGIASVVLFYLFYGQAGPNTETIATIRAAHIAAIVREAESAKSATNLEPIVKRAERHNMEVRVISTAGAETLDGSSTHEPSPIAKTIVAVLRETWGLAPTLRDNSIIVKISDDRALRFRLLPRNGLHNLMIIQTTCAVAIVTFIILFLSIYALRWITAPLSSIASAARSFGGAGTEDVALQSGGPREILQVSEALNDMRKRVRSLVDERTQMLVAISHDLRTPLTRLRLRAERLENSETKEGMLRDIATVNGMLSETLAYLRDGGGSEPAQLIDLPSLLQTICAQFADMGQNVAYNGPRRLAFACRAQALGRAVTNIADNGLKYGCSVAIELKASADGSAQIEIADDGPGVPASLRSKVFEPFYRGDSARSSQGRPGFGLGLSIARDIVRRHGGDIELLDHAPHGLIVRLSIKEIADGKTWAAVRSTVEARGVASPAS